MDGLQARGDRAKGTVIMDAKQCRAEAVTCEELDVATEGTDGHDILCNMAVMQARALWEIAAQLAELTQLLGCNSKFYHGALQECPEVAAGKRTVCPGHRLLVHG